jgi:hypothetical protein
LLCVFKFSMAATKPEIPMAIPMFRWIANTMSSTLTQHTTFTYLKIQYISQNRLYIFCVFV